jgi:hypothetical protein
MIAERKLIFMRVGVEQDGRGGGRLINPFLSSIHCISAAKKHCVLSTTALLGAELEAFLSFDWHSKTSMFLAGMVMFQVKNVIKRVDIIEPRDLSTQ